MAIKDITTPDFGSATDVTVVEILVKPGDKVEVDTPIVTFESDKATMELPSPSAGRVKEIKIKVGDKVATGGVILSLETEGAAEKPAPTVSGKKASKASKAPEVAEAPEVVEAAPQAKAPKAASQAIETPEEEKPKKEEPKPEILSGELQSTSDVHAGPGARQLARELGVDLTLVPASGPKQRILKEDVQQFVKNQLSQIQPRTSPLPAPVIDFSKYGTVETIMLSRIQKIAGNNLQRNWVTIPHVTQFNEADITTLEEFRQSQKAKLEKEKIKLTPLVFVMKAVVASLKAFPHFNASLDSTGQSLILKNYFHIGVAVDTPDGLVVPVIRHVDKKGLIELAVELGLVSEKARKRQLTPHDMQGGCFSISSLGGIGGIAFTPIINAPEVAILGVSQASYKPVYKEDTFVPRLMLPLSLSFDHRVIDGADGARFIVHLTNMLADIRNLLM